MRLFRRKRRGPEADRPEHHAGLVLLTRDGRWHLYNANAGVPARGGPGAGEINGPALAEGFRESWVRAQGGAKRVRGLDGWVAPVARVTPDPELGGPAGGAAAWREFFLGGGVVFSLRTAPDQGITATRCCWVWPAAGREVVHAGTRPTDRYAVTGSDDWQLLAHDPPAWHDAPMWTEAAAWLAEHTADDSRCAAWWTAGASGAPDVAVADPSEAVRAVRRWWSAEAPAAAIEKYRLPLDADPDAGPDPHSGPDDAGPSWRALLGWDPQRSRHPDGLAAVLGGRPGAGDSVDLAWWDIEAGGAPGRPWRVGGLSPAQAEDLAAGVVATGHRLPTVDWQRA